MKLKIFFILSILRSKRYDGSGLGLCIAKLIVDIHLEVINIKNEEEKETKMIDLIKKNEF